MKIYLIRHAETDSNKGNRADSQIDSKLTKKGMIEARGLISRLQKIDADIFIVSPLKRTILTLKPYLNTLQKPMIVVSELTAERDLGDFTGTPVGSFQDYCDKNNKSKIFYRPKNGESIDDTYERAKMFYSYLKKEYNDKNILVCGHKNFLMCMETLLRNLKIKDCYHLSPLKNVEIREFDF